MKLLPLKGDLPAHVQDVEDRRAYLFDMIEADQIAAIEAAVRARSEMLCTLVDGLYHIRAKAKEIWGS